MAREIVQCLECNGDMTKVKVAFFTDQKGSRRYGAICKKCLKTAKKRE